MAEITEADLEDFFNKVKRATDDISHAKLIEEIKGLITRKPNLLKARDHHCRNCFHYLLSVELAAFIYKRRPSFVNETDKYGSLPIHSAAYDGRLPIVKFIAEKEPTMLHATTTHDRMTPLLEACMYDHLNVVEWILLHDPSTANYVDNNGWTALHLVALCETGQNAVECAKLLLKVNTEMRWARSRDGNTPLMIARRWDSNSEVTLFLGKLDKHDESIADSKSFWSTVKAMLLAMEADKQAIAPLCDSTATKTKKAAIDALVVVAEWTKSVALNAKNDITNLIRSKDSEYTWLLSILD